MPLLRTKTTIVNSGDVFGDVFGFFKKTGFVIQKDCILKGQCHEISETFFVDKKNSTWAPNEQAKRVSQIFHEYISLQKIAKKHVSL